MLMDASALVDLFVPSANAVRIRGHLEHSREMPIISDFAAGEFAGAVKRRCMMKLIEAEEAVTLLGKFDAWTASNTESIATEPADIRLAAIYVRRLDINLRMPDALYLATARRLDVPLCSFDAEQVAAAKKLGIDVVELP